MLLLRAEGAKTCGDSTQQLYKQNPRLQKAGLEETEDFGGLDLAVISFSLNCSRCSVVDNDRMGVGFQPNTGTCCMLVPSLAVLWFCCEGLNSKAS
jgi:hypothetical protein